MCLCVIALTFCTFMIIHSCVTVFVQQFLHAAECDRSKVTRVFQLEEALQVGRSLATSHIHTLTVYCIQPQIKTIKITLCRTKCSKCVYSCITGS